MSFTNDSATELARFLDRGAAPIYVLDEDRQIIFCNAACANWVGLAADALVGQRCNYHSPRSDAQGMPEPAEIAAGLCPPPEVFAGQPGVALVSCARAGGRVETARRPSLITVNGAGVRTGGCGATR